MGGLTPKAPPLPTPLPTAFEGHCKNFYWTMASSHQIMYGWCKMCLET